MACGCTQKKTAPAPSGTLTAGSPLNTNPALFEVVWYVDGQPYGDLVDAQNASRTLHKPISRRYEPKV